MASASTVMTAVTFGTGSAARAWQSDHLDASMNVEMDLPESVAWLYHRYRDRMRGERYDKVRWAGNVFGSMEESARVAQERAIEAIESRMEIAYIRNDQDEYMALEEYRDRIGFLL